MKRMMLLANLMVVFSLTTSTAIAGTGVKAGEGPPNGDTVMNMAQERSRLQVQEPACQAGDPDSDCEGEPARTQTREETQIGEGDGECLGTDEECGADQERIQARDRDQIRSNDGEGEQTRTQTREETQIREHGGECLGTDEECDANQEQTQARDRDQIRASDGECVETGNCEQRHEMNRSEMEERIMKRFAFVDDSGDGEYLRALVRWMYAHMYGPFSAVFT